MPAPLLSSDHRYQLTREVWKDTSNQEIREFVYAYDTVGNLLTVADNTINPSNGVRTTASDALQFVYDSRDQLQLERAVNPLVAVSTVLDHDYDLNGRATALATNLGGTISGSNITGGVKDLTNQYAWDALGRLTSVNQTSQYGGNSVAAKLATFQYDAASQLTDLRRYSSTSAYSMYLEVHSRMGYDGAGRLQSMTHAKSEIASGQMWNGTSTLPTSLQGGKLLAGYFLAYDQDNRLTGWSSYADAFKTTFAYDTRDQVTGATHTAIAGLTLPRAMPASENYAFDGTGNRNLSGGSSSSANGTFNRVQNDGTYTYDFDAEGNQIRRTKISDGKVTEYEYDYRNRLVKVTEKNSLAGAATKVVTYQYDAFDRRTGKQLDSDANGTVDRKMAWVWDGQQVVMQFADADGAGAGAWKLTNRYLYGDAVDLVLADEQLPSGGIGLTSVSYTTGNVLWPLFDQLGSLRDVVDSNGVIRQHLVFDSFGNRLSETDYNTSGVVIPNNDPAAVDELFGYTGREWDSDVKLQYNRARWYDPAQGRWISQDPIGFSAGDVNLYRYVGNGTTGATDPSGLEEFNWAGGLGHHPIPRTVFENRLGYYFTVGAKRFLEKASIDPQLYAHGNDTWKGITHPRYIDAVESIVREYKYRYSPNNLLTESQAEDIIRFLLNKQSLSKLSDVADDVADARKYMTGFFEGICAARELKALDETLTSLEIKALVREMVNEGKKLEDFPRLATALRKWNGLGTAAKKARIAKFAKYAGPVLAVLGTLLSTRNAVACEGDLAESTSDFDDLPVHTRVMLQLSYDSVMAHEVETFLLRPAATGWSEWWHNLFGLGGMSLRERQVRDVLEKQKQMLR